VEMILLVLMVIAVCVVISTSVVFTFAYKGLEVICNFIFKKKGDK